MTQIVCWRPGPGSSLPTAPKSGLPPGYRLPPPGCHSMSPRMLDAVEHWPIAMTRRSRAKDPLNSDKRLHQAGREALESQRGVGDRQADAVVPVVRYRLMLDAVVRDFDVAPTEPSAEAGEATEQNQRHFQAVMAVRGNGRASGDLEYARTFADRGAIPLRKYVRFIARDKSCAPTVKLRPGCSRIRHGPGPGDRRVDPEQEADDARRPDGS